MNSFKSKRGMIDCVRKFKPFPPLKLQNHQDGKVVEFPFKDLHPQGSDLGWEGKVTRQLKIDIKRMGIITDDNLIKSVLKVRLRQV